MLDGVNLNRHDTCISFKAMVLLSWMHPGYTRKHMLLSFSGLVLQRLDTLVQLYDTGYASVGMGAGLNWRNFRQAPAGGMEPTWVRALLKMVNVGFNIAVDRSQYPCSQHSRELTSIGS